jgi:hypothetical protein
MKSFSFIPFSHMSSAPNSTNIASNDVVFEKMTRLQKSLRIVRLLRGVARGFSTVPLILYIVFWIFLFALGASTPSRSHDGEGLGVFVMILVFLGYTGVPLLLVPLGAWIGFGLWCRNLESRLATLASSIR